MPSRVHPRALAALVSAILLGACGTTASPTPIRSASLPPPGASASASATSGSSCASPPATADLPWWNDRVFYEVFVRSFGDSDGDGIGDLRGLIDRLDYLNDGDPSTTDDLGVTGIWLMPVAESPSYHGYDVVDYRSIERDYGTTEDFQALIDAAHDRGIAVIVDFVMNHTSREHPWFRDALTPGSEREDWYLWADERPRGVTRPGGGRVWHEANGRFYYGYFWEGMPDLNLANDEVTAELDAIARYWLEELGVDGFRLDAIKHFFEDGKELEDVPESKVWLTGFHERVHEIAREALLVGEAYDPTTSAAAYVPDSVDLTFDFGAATAALVGLRNGRASIVRSALEESLAAYPPGQRAVFLTNHDQPRVMTELGGSVGAARVAATLLLTVPGVPFIYYGEEIGLEGTKPDERIRTPMPWDGSATGGGFTTGKPWQPFFDTGPDANVATQAGDEASLLSHYRNLVHLRAAHPSLAGADAVVLETEADSVLAMARRSGGETTIVLANMDDEPASRPAIDLAAALPCGSTVSGAEVLLGEAAITPPSGDLDAWVPVETLGAYESLVIRLNP